MLTSTTRSLNNRSFMTDMVMSACSSKYSSCLDITSTVIFNARLPHASPELLFNTAPRNNATRNSDGHGVRGRHSQPVLAGQVCVEDALLSAGALVALGFWPDGRENAEESGVAECAGQ
ncbi:hypothetical protein PC128_g25338 [Phytophthora cactorum]|nr:hypothetical protein PC120_g24724 [Phytophthora cactorum]KAG3043061.1 hypothetical protein PC121_g22780 [Phytophthora cactorum]KAG3139642.1 hypothetical protein PC128_g25338 [Phytophthora cactorum]KAG4039193.1 hypothetical protein PC123_g25252 [Phytophthora cactorum]